MTNGEKFKEVFGFKPDSDTCPIPNAVCDEMRKDNPKLMCIICPFSGWFKKEYKPCFRMKIYDDGK